MGDVVAVTSTDFNPDAEEFTIAAISGVVVTLSAGLARPHTSRQWTADNGSGAAIDMRARVLNLQSNIEIAADDGAAQWAGGDPLEGAKFGAHVVAADEGVAKLHHTAVRFCGQLGEERGCVKFAAAVEGSELVDCATAFGAPRSSVFAFCSPAGVPCGLLPSAAVLLTARSGCRVHQKC